MTARAAGSASSAPRPIPTIPGIYIERDSDWLETAWTSVPNELIRNPEVDWDAKGAFAWLASHQEMAFRVTAQQLADAGPRGRNHAYDMIRELERWGWLTRRRVRNPESGFNDIQVYRLHTRAVPPEQRTYKPSRAKPRPKTSFLDKAGPSVPARSGTEDQGAPARENPSSGFITDRAGTEGGVSDRAVSDRAEPLYEKTKGEDQGGDCVTGERHQRERTPASEPPPAEKEPPSTPPASPAFDWGNPRCRDHRHVAADDRGPDCPACGRAKAWVKAQRAAKIERENAEGSACRMCIPDGKKGDGLIRWLRVLPGTQVPVTPYDPCDHKTSHAERLAQLEATEAARVVEARQPIEAAPIAAAGRAEARRIFRGPRRDSGCATRRPAAPQPRQPVDRVDNPHYNPTLAQRAAPPDPSPPDGGTGDGVSARELAETGV